LLFFVNIAVFFLAEADPAQSDRRPEARPPPGGGAAAGAGEAEGDRADEAGTDFTTRKKEAI